MFEPLAQVCGQAQGPSRRRIVSLYFFCKYYGPPTARPADSCQHLSASLSGYFYFFYQNNINLDSAPNQHAEQKRSLAARRLSSTSQKHIRLERLEEHSTETILRKVIGCHLLHVRYSNPITGKLDLPRPQVLQPTNRRA